ncbi:MAG: hypothetical protein ABIG68_09355 [Acidobacteriota bacterium]
MINFPCSTFTWKARPARPDPHYRYTGGFVGTPGQVYHVRFNLEARCEVRDQASDHAVEMFAGAPCRSEYTIADRNLFQVPSSEWRLAFSRRCRLNIAARPSREPEPSPAVPLSELFQEYSIDVRSFGASDELTDAGQIVEATLANDLLNAQSTYRDPGRGLTVTVEFPVNLINVNQADDEFQVCTGPIILPDLATWDGGEVSRVFLAHVAFSGFDHVEFILRREVEAAPSEREWLDRPRGRDRVELRDPADPPPGHPPARPRPTAYSEVWELEATNVVTRAPNPAPAA